MKDFMLYSDLFTHALLTLNSADTTGWAVRVKVNVWTIWPELYPANCAYIALHPCNVRLNPSVNRAGHCPGKSQWAAGCFNTGHRPETLQLSSSGGSEVHRVRLLCSFLLACITFQSADNVDIHGDTCNIVSCQLHINFLNSFTALWVDIQKNIRLG